MKALFILTEELVRYRALISALVVRTLAQRYRGSFLGFIWSILNPLLLMLVYLLVFHYYIRFASVENYPIFMFSGLLPWIWTASSLNEGTCSVVSSGHLITKSIFPAQILPLVAVLANLCNFLLSLPVLFVLMAYLGVLPGNGVILLPLLILLQTLFLVGVVLILSTANVLFRDVQHLVASLLTLLFFLCPIVYSSDVVPEHLRWTLFLNPIALFTKLYHVAILGQGDFLWGEVGFLALVTLLVLGVGSAIFYRCREEFAEMV